jgi:hypothetical protein
MRHPAKPTVILCLRAFASTVAALAISATFVASTHASTHGAIAPSLSPNRLHAKAALTFTIQYTSSESGLPAPVRRAVLRLPAGLSLDIPDLRSCNPTRLQLHGARSCPARSAIGSGHALVEGNLGTRNLIENVSLRAFLGPPLNLQPTFEILSEGFKPIGAQFVLTATASPDRAPYGEELVVSIPPIPTVPNEPDASVITFSLTIGTSRASHRSHATAVLVPPTCPAGGFPFAAEFTYADGSGSSALATFPCPR